MRSWRALLTPEQAALPQPHRPAGNPAQLYLGFGNTAAAEANSAGCTTTMSPF
jgi:hypothetical protein